MQKTTVSGVRLKGICSTLPKIAVNSTNGSSTIYKCYEEQTTSDLGYDAARRLIQNLEIDVSEIGFLILGTKTPDYRSPITSAILQSRLGLSLDCICYDINVGANGFMLLSQIGSSIIQNLNKRFGIIIFGDTPSKLRNGEKHVMFELSDAASALIIEKTGSQEQIDFYHKNLGEYYDSFLLKVGGFRDFDRTIRFDASNIENFIVLEKTDTFRNALAAIDIREFYNEYDDADYIFHSNFQKIPNSDFNVSKDERLLADASELPIYMEKNKEILKSKTHIMLWSMGEGLSIYGMKINHLPIFEKTEFSDEIFSDYMVSHEM